MQETVTLRGFDGAGSANNLSTPVEDVVNAFQTAFDKEWAKRSRKLQLTQPVRIEGYRQERLYLHRSTFHHSISSDVARMRVAANSLASSHPTHQPAGAI